ncbi:SOS response-associated peptidase [Mucisphaera calidilacus]|uniref:Abasic site processing protein n=1 Tax=Mucisphaera calidilacus TaxID=2527982 RepID=A0A518BYA5_9BACT|nr:SOS response-associated peptidase [Mucisphaera calidilacus]QDU71960.1 Putative SOS response-associated peptidase YedK [Mucisphaera calidilacus]
MCARFTITLDLEDIADLYGVSVTDIRHTPAGTHPYAHRTDARHNIGPRDLITIVQRNHHHQTQLNRVWWDFTPTRQPRPDRTWHNAVSEKARDTQGVGRIYRSALRHSRCLIPFQGFYEWQRQLTGPKQPWCIRPTNHARHHAFAGITSRWTDRQGNTIEGATLFTTRANSLMSWIHNEKPRMPVILDPDRQAQWLSPDLDDPDTAAELLQPLPDHTLEAWPVARRLNNPRTDHAACATPTGDTLNQPPTDDTATRTLFD